MCPRSGFGTGEHLNVPSFRFLVPGNVRMYPCSGFWYRVTSTKTTVLENHPFESPESNNIFRVICVMSKQSGVSKLVWGSRGLHPDFRAWFSSFPGKSQRVKTQSAQIQKTSPKKKVFAEDISEDFSEDRRDHFLLDFRIFLDIFIIFAEDCFPLRSFRKFLPSGFLLRTLSTTTRDRNLQFRGAVSIGSFCFFSSFYVQFSKTSPLKSGESSENPVEKIASNPVTSVVVMIYP